MERGRFSPAALALMSRGVTLTRIAAALGTTRQSVSRWLAGRYSAPPELFGAIAALGGHELADEVAELIGQAREPVA